MNLEQIVKELNNRKDELAWTTGDVKDLTEYALCRALIDMVDVLDRAMIWRSPKPTHNGGWCGKQETEE